MSPGDRKALTWATILSVLFLAPMVARAVSFPPQGSGGGASVDLSAVAEDVVPDADSTRDLGSSSKAWALTYSDAVYTSSVRAQGSAGLALATNVGGALVILNQNYDANMTLVDDLRVAHGSGEDVFQQGELTTLTDGSATTVFSVVTGDGDMAGLVVNYTIQATDGTEYQSESGTVRIAIVDDAGGVVASTPGESSVQALSSGTLTSAWTVVTTDDQSIEVQLNATSSLTTTTCQVRWHAVYSGDVTLTVP